MFWAGFGGFGSLFWVSGSTPCFTFIGPNTGTGHDGPMDVLLEWQYWLQDEMRMIWMFFSVPRHVPSIFRCHWSRLKNLWTPRLWSRKISDPDRAKNEVQSKTLTVQLVGKPNRSSQMLAVGPWLHRQRVVEFTGHWSNKRYLDLISALLIYNSKNILSLGASLNERTYHHSSLCVK